MPYSGRPTAPQPVRFRTPREPVQMPRVRPVPNTYGHQVMARPGEPQTSAPRGAVPVRYRSR